MDKAQVRASVLATRKTLENRKEMSENACQIAILQEQFINAKTVFTYNAYGSELDVFLLNMKAAELGKRICYPVCDGKGHMYAASGEQFELDMYGIPSPPANCPEIDPQEIDLVIMPAVAFDATGARIGYGAGYYDRFLPKCPNAFKFGMVFTAQIVQDAFSQPHDCKADIIITETGIINPRALENLQQSV